MGDGVGGSPAATRRGPLAEWRGLRTGKRPYRGRADVVPASPCPSGSAALCALVRCRAERGNGREEPKSGKGTLQPLSWHTAGDVLHAAASGSRSVAGGVVRTAPGVGNLERVDAGHADGLSHRDVAAGTCDGGAVERGRGREAGVLMGARQGEARAWYGWTRRPTCSPSGSTLARFLRTRIRMGRLTPLGVYIISLASDPIRGSHRLDPNFTSSATLISRPPNVKLLENRHLSRAHHTVWIATAPVDNA